MGHIAMQTRNEGRGLAEWAYLCLGEKPTVAWLIVNRSRMDRTYYALMSGVADGNELPTMHEPIFCTYADLDQLIDTCGLSDGERKIIDALMAGYTITDLAEICGWQKQTVDVQYRRALAKIVEQNDRNWTQVYTQKKDS